MIYFTNEHIYRERLKICKGCELFNAPLNQCKHCKCIMTVKAKFEAAKCPIKKW